MDGWMVGGLWGLISTMTMSCCASPSLPSLPYHPTRRGFYDRHSLLLLPSPPLQCNGGVPSLCHGLPRGGLVLSRGCSIRCMASSSAAGAPMELPFSASRPFGVLFVCLGNICRSPTAEAVFRHVVEKRGLETYFNIDSAGTIDYHEGEPADSRMKAAAIKRGVKLTSISRPIHPSDFEKFDLILAMDRKNKEDIIKAHRLWSSRQALPPNSAKKVRMICEYCKKYTEDEVPDPYYGGPAGFEKVLDLLEDACESLLDSIVPSIMKSEGTK